MEIKRQIMGLYGTNTYLLQAGTDCLIIDPAGRLSSLEKLLEDKKPLAILLTHGHFDHIKGVDELYKKYQLPIYLHEADFAMTDPAQQQKHYAYNRLAHISAPLIALKEGKMCIGPFSFEVIHTPGHTAGSVCYLFGKDLFCGDTLFKGSIGRCDLYGGNDAAMKRSLRLLAQYDPELILHPGHQEESTLAEELKNNPFMRQL